MVITTNERRAQHWVESMEYSRRFYEECRIVSGGIHGKERMFSKGCSYAVTRVVGNYAANRRFMLEIMIENLTNYKVATRRQKECC
ncbi:(+)-copalyl diphosphate synthase 3, chloroplastic [Dirofilaria immitis]